MNKQYIQSRGTPKITKKLKTSWVTVIMIIKTVKVREEAQQIHWYTWQKRKYTEQNKK